MEVTKWLTIIFSSDFLRRRRPKRDLIAFPEESSLVSAYSVPIDLTMKVSRGKDASKRIHLQKYRCWTNLGPSRTMCDRSFRPI